MANKLAKAIQLVPNLKEPMESGGKRTPLPSFLKSSLAETNRSAETPQTVRQTALIEPESITLSSGTVSEPDLGSKKISFRDGLQVTKVLGRVHQTFILAESNEGFIVIDQHAAHEKVRYEALIQEFNSKKPSQQRLLMDEMLEVSQKNIELLKEVMPLLNRLGFEIDAFGEQTYVIRAIPAVLVDENAVELVRRFLEEKEEGKVSTNLENYQEDVAALIACKRQSVKAHDAMTPEAVTSLVEQLANCQNPFNCPHGRPAILKYTFAELEKQFKRKL